MVLLDTDHISLLQRDDSAEADRLTARLERLPAGAAATTVITYEEQTRGWLVAISSARTIDAQVTAYRRLLRHVDDYRLITVLAYDETAAKEFQRLRRAGIRIGTMDLRIAVIALVTDRILLTRNRVDFEKVPGLRFEDWTV